MQIFTFISKPKREDLLRNLFIYSYKKKFLQTTLTISSLIYTICGEDDTLEWVVSIILKSQ